tara:strand:- start:613 stop:1014 length:402 start_codon:yes stop_codon:yes gene_type:complete
MPSIKKRIGYLPSPLVKEIISNIANNKNISQSKVVGILVEEGLISRGLLDLNNKNNLSGDNSNIIKKNSFDESFIKYNDLDELISDKGITYNRQKYKQTSENIISKSKEAYNKELFEQFRQFLLFQQMKKEKE